MADILGIGASVLDTLLLTDAFPTAGSRLRTSQIRIQSGGACAVTLSAAARMGVGAAYMGIETDDEAGRALLRDFEKCGVETRCTDVRGGFETPRSFVLAGGGACARVTHEGTVPAPVPADVSLPEIPKSRLLHLDGHHFDAAIHAARYAHLQGLKISFCPDETYDGIERLLPFVNFLIVSEDVALPLSGRGDPDTAAVTLMAQYRPELVIVTQGEKGGLLILDRQAPTRIPGFATDAVDPVGETDIFCGAFIAAYLRGYGDYAACAVFASAAAAIKRARVGAFEGAPGYDETLAFLKERI